MSLLSKCSPLLPTIPSLSGALLLSVATVHLTGAQEGNIALNPPAPIHGIQTWESNRTLEQWQCTEANCYDVDADGMCWCQEKSCTKVRTVVEGTWVTDVIEGDIAMRAVYECVDEEHAVVFLADISAPTTKSILIGNFKCSKEYFPMMMPDPNAPPPKPTYEMWTGCIFFSPMMKPDEAKTEQFKSYQTIIEAAVGESYTKFEPISYAFHQIAAEARPDGVARTSIAYPPTAPPVSGSIGFNYKIQYDVISSSTSFGRLEVTLHVPPRGVSPPEVLDYNKNFAIIEPFPTLSPASPAAQGMPVGTLAGIVIASVAAALIIAALALFFFMKKRRTVGSPPYGAQRAEPQLKWPAQQLKDTAVHDDEASSPSKPTEATVEIGIMQVEAAPVMGKPLPICSPSKIDEAEMENDDDQSQTK